MIDAKNYINDAGITTESTTKIIYNFIDVERSLAITWDEIRRLLAIFPYGHPYRIGFSLLACCGMRGAELQDLRLNDFLNEDLTELRYRIKKIRPKKYQTGTQVFNIKLARRKIPKCLADEIKYYIKYNFHLLKEGRLFQFTANSLRHYLSQLRTKAKKGQLGDPVLSSALLEQTGFRFGFNTTYAASSYRISLHSFRRFYDTYHYYTTFDKDLSALCRHVGHRFEETTRGYIYYPEQIGLTSELMQKKKAVESLIFDKNQRRIDEY